MAFKVKDIDFHPAGTGIALIRRGKPDAEGQGRSAYLSRETVRWAEDLAGTCEHRRRNTIPAAHRSESNRRTPKPREHRADIQKRVAQWIGMPERYLKLISGHSTREGATQAGAPFDDLRP